MTYNTKLNFTQVSSAFNGSLPAPLQDFSPSYMLIGGIGGGGGDDFGPRRPGATPVFDIIPVSLYKKISQLITTLAAYYHAAIQESQKSLEFLANYMPPQAQIIQDFFAYPVSGAAAASAADPLALDSTGRSPLHRAANDGDIDTLEALFSNGGDLNLEDKQGMTPLACACSSVDDRSDIIKFLLENKADLNKGKTLKPIHYAAAYGHINNVQALLDAGAEVNQLDSMEQTPLTRAASRVMSDDSAKIRLLIQHGANLYTEGESRSPFHLAVTVGNMNNIQALLDAGVDVNYRYDEGESHFNWVCRNRRDRSDIIKYFIKCGAKVNEDGINGSPLLLAVKYGHIKNIQALLDAEAEVNQKSGPNHQTPLDAAICRKDSEIIKLLENAGAVSAANSEEENIEAAANSEEENIEAAANSEEENSNLDCVIQ